jgi:hypothetical protein
MVLPGAALSPSCSVHARQTRHTAYVFPGTSRFVSRRRRRMRTGMVPRRSRGQREQDNRKPKQ